MEGSFLAMKEQSSVTSGGLGVLGVLTILFVVLKLLHVIEWSWLIVFLPVLIGLALKILWIVVAVLIALLGSRRRRN